MPINLNLHCNHCGADFERNSLEENIRLISGCTNCIADLLSKGKWTGVGHNIMTKLVEKHGLEIVKYTNEKINFESI